MSSDNSVLSGKRENAAKVLRESRGWTQPSDHVPVVVELD